MFVPLYVAYTFTVQYVYKNAPVYFRYNYTYTKSAIFLLIEFQGARMQTTLLRNRPQHIRPRAGPV